MKKEIFKLEFNGSTWELIEEEGEIYFYINGIEEDSISADSDEIHYLIKDIKRQMLDTFFII